MLMFKTLEGIDKWVEEHSEKCQTKAFDGAQFEYKFIPAGLVMCQTVKCLVCKEEHTEYIDY